MRGECFTDVRRSLEKLRNSLVHNRDNIDEYITGDVNLFAQEMTTAGFPKKELDEAISIYKHQLKNHLIRQIESQLKEIDALEQDLKEETVDNLKKFTRKGLAYLFS